MFFSLEGTRFACRRESKELTTAVRASLRGIESRSDGYLSHAAAISAFVQADELGEQEPKRLAVGVQSSEQTGKGCKLSGLLNLEDFCIRQYSRLIIGKVQAQMGLT